MLDRYSNTQTLFGCFAAVSNRTFLGPMYNMFLIYPKAGYPDRFGSGWHLDYDVTTAETVLAQRPGFSTFVMSQLTYVHLRLKLMTSC